MKRRVNRKKERLGLILWLSLMLVCVTIAFGSSYYYAARETDAAAYLAHQHQLPFDICKDPHNYGLHSNGCREGMCFGFAINLLNRLQHEAPDTTAEIWTFMGCGEPQPTAPKDPTDDPGPVGVIWGHAIVVFWTWWDNKMYACDENVGQAIEIDLSQVDWTCGVEDGAVLTSVMRQLWAHFPTRYPFAFDSFNFSAPDILKGKADVLKNFDPIANDYFTMQAHPYYFPPDWCVD